MAGNNEAVADGRDLFVGVPGGVQRMDDLLVGVFEILVRLGKHGRFC